MHDRTSYLTINYMLLIHILITINRWGFGKWLIKDIGYFLALRTIFKFLNQFKKLWPVNLLLSRMDCRFTFKDMMLIQTT